MYSYVKARAQLVNCNGSQNVTILKNEFAFFQTSSQFFQLALNVKCQVKFSGDEFLEPAPKFRKRKKKIVRRVSIRPP